MTNRAQGMMSEITSIWEYLGFGKRHAGAGAHPGRVALPETDTVRKIVNTLNDMEPDRARYIAAFAYLLSRVAHADRVTSPEETREMERIVSERGGLSPDQAALIVEIAKSQNALFGGTENFLVGREFDRIATHEQKINLLHCLYAVCAADKSISTTEDHEIRSIARELKLSHPEYIDVRLAYREYLSVLKKTPPTQKP